MPTTHDPLQAICTMADIVAELELMVWKRFLKPDKSEIKKNKENKEQKEAMQEWYDFSNVSLDTQSW